MRRISEQKIPPSLQGILWSKSRDRLDWKADKVYIIHQVLSYGTLKHIKRLFRVYTAREIREVFVHHPKKVYRMPVFYLVKNIILDLKDKPIAPEKYVKTAF